MERKPPQILKAAEIEEKGRWYTQRLNPRSRFRGTWLSREGGLARSVVDFAVLEPGHESFALHAHLVEEEWLYVVQGHPTLLTEDGEAALAPGDFVAFPAPQRAHNLANRTAERVVYLMGGETGIRCDVLDYPTLGRSYALVRRPGEPSAFRALGPEEHPFGPIDEE